MAKQLKAVTPVASDADGAAPTVKLRTYEHGGQVYRHNDIIRCLDHPTNGGEVREFRFNYAEERPEGLIVWVYEWEHVKGGWAITGNRAFHPDRIETNEQKEKAMAAKADEKKATRKPAAPKVGTCEYTGKPTKGGRFRPGMDAALKGALLFGARKGDVDDATELAVRNWPLTDVDPALVTKATKAARDNEAKADEWVAKRVAARLAKVAKGTDPFKAVTGVDRPKTIKKAVTKEKVSA